MSLSSDSKPKKRIKQDVVVLTNLIEEGAERHRALELCAQALPGSVLAAALWRQAVPVLVRELKPFSGESDKLSAALGTYLLMESQRPAHLIQDAIELARSVFLSSGTDSWEIQWYALHAVSSALQLDEFAAEALFKRFGLQPWYQQPQTMESLREEISKKEKWNGELPVAGELGEKEQEVIANVHGLLIPRATTNGSAAEPPRLEKALHPPTSQRNLRDVALSLLTSPSHVPLVLQGGPGSGKTWTIRTLAQMCNKELIELQLDDQADSKTLLGSMTCVKGTFAWMPGALTTAVREGKWVLIEDIDACPLEIVTSLKPLFEAGRLSLPNRSNSFDLEVSNGFRLFGTTRKDDFKLHRCSLEVSIEGLSKEELIWVCSHRFPEQSPTTITMVVENHFALYQVDPTISPAQKIRDLFKWFERIRAFCSTITPARTDFLTEKAKTSVVLEGIDVVTSRMPARESRILFARNLAVRWGLSPETGSGLIQSRRPELAFDEETKTWRAGRVLLSFPRNCVPKEFNDSFAPTSVSLHTLEQVAACVFLNEPCLLVGETGAGKTSMLQLMAKCCGKTLVVQNMHVQSDSTEFLGGFKPAPSLRQEANALYTEFLALFESSFDAQENEKFLNAVLGYCEEGKWKKLCKALETACSKYFSAMKAEKDKESTMMPHKKIKREHDVAWTQLFNQVETFKIKSQSKDLFTFVEGVLVRSLRNGDWILLDEVNLASGETLERLLPLLEDSKSSLSLTERGDVEKIPRHPEFRLFAAMNPSTDFGKKNLPPALRSRFTEIYVDEATEDSDIRLVVERFLGQDARDQVEPVVACFLRSRELSKSTLVDGNGQAPRYSLRTLVRTLQAARSLATTQRFGMKRALFESFLALFTTSLDPPSCTLLTREVARRLFGDEKIPSFSAGKPSDKKDKVLVCEDSYWLDKGKEEIASDEKFVSTPHVEAKLKLLARAVALKRYPILLQGPTSAGKTSLIAHLARMTGNRFVRINNHEHTDLEEYLGSYVADDTGKLVYHYGSLVEAVTKGYWIVLDELNLAPSDVLEALNRLLDDNRELFLAETQETIVPHPNFLLFATQNPPGGAYGGRKQLSKAFRNRFLEIHLDDIPHNELETILEKRNRIPPSFSKAMVNVMKELQFIRSKSHLFAGKSGLITPRDLMRWADRDPRSYQELAEDGYRLLGERLRSAEEREEVRSVIEKFCRAQISFANLYQVPPSVRDDLVWTESMKRLFSLVHACALKMEPCLIVGETGLGKTRCVQAVAKTFNTDLVVLNCHQNTETADILGSLRPVRYRSEIAARLKDLQGQFQVKSLQELIESPQVPLQIKEEVNGLVGKSLKLFEWADGPLVESMRRGEFFLLDEISLAEDAVLERLNSVLETGRTLTLAERGGQVVEVLKAHEEFRAFATMNPGGDFGKRELSPALRNRFTEIWLPSITDFEDFRMVVEQVFTRGGGSGASPNETTNGRFVAERMVQFTKWFNQQCETKHQNFAPLSMRDLIAWAEFVRETALKTSSGEQRENVDKLYLQMFAHGCFLTCLDGLGVGSGFGGIDSKQRFLSDCRAEFPDIFAYEKGNYNSSDGDNDVVILNTSTQFGVPPFIVSKEKKEEPSSSSSSSSSSAPSTFEFNAPTTRLNLVRLLRAMQLKRAILLEGSPGVGKTTIVSALARALGKKIVRINLSEQTDFSDLIGSDLPVPASSSADADDSQQSSATTMQFQWSDGVFLQALKNGDWVLLDELNLASQSVLEGLNSVLDHRASVFVPELNRTFSCSSQFRVFACQNPLQQGGGRKGLPKSFLNRFTKVYVEALDEKDYLQIASTVFPDIHGLEQIIRLTKEMHRMVSSSSEGGEFNLRDVFRFCEMRRKYRSAKVVFDLLYASRFGLGDASKCETVFQSIFGDEEDNDEGGDDHFDWFRVQTQQDSSRVLFGGQECVMRRETGVGDSHGDLSLTPGFPSRLVPMLVRVAQCVNQSYPVLLVGETGSGKSLVLKELAGMLGKKIHVFQMTSGTDSTELLGCFEQIDPNHTRLETLVAMADRIKLELERNVLLNGDSHRDQTSSAALLTCLGELEAQRSELIACAQELLAGGTRHSSDDLDRVFHNAVAVLERTCESSSSAVEMKDFLESMSVEWSKTTRDEQKGKSQPQASGFQWVDGTLLRAMERGEWIVLDDANLCSPTVLDRLNSLLEPSGELMVNEQGTTLQGGLRVCRPHPDFRIFLTIDPRSGLVSRAMRNRCVELFFNPRLYSSSARDRRVYLEEGRGLQDGEWTSGVDDIQAAAREVEAKAELGLIPLREVWRRRTLPVPLSIGRDLRREQFVSRVRLSSKIVRLYLDGGWGGGDMEVIRKQLKQAMRGVLEVTMNDEEEVRFRGELIVDGVLANEDVRTTSAIALLMSIVQTLQTEERLWLKSQLSRESPSFVERIVQVMLADGQDVTRTERRRRLERLAVTIDESGNETQKTEGPVVSARFLQETFEALTAWMVAREKCTMEDLPLELQDARDDFWRAVMSSSSSSSADQNQTTSRRETKEPLNVCWRRLVKQLARTTVALGNSGSSREEREAWVHMENVAKRFDSALKRPCWEELMSSSSSSSTSLLNEEPSKRKHIVKAADEHPKPPTDIEAFDGYKRLAVLCKEESIVSSISSSESSPLSVEATVLRRGEQWRRDMLSALCTLRFSGSGGGVGQQRRLGNLDDKDEDNKKEIAKLRDAAIKTVLGNSASQATVMEFPQVLPLCERIVALMESEVRGLVARIVVAVASEESPPTQTSILNLVEEVRQASRRVIDFSLNTNCKPLTQLAVYQELVWTSETGLETFMMTCRTLLSELMISAEELEWRGHSLSFHSLSKALLVQPKTEDGLSRGGSRASNNNSTSILRVESLTQQNSLPLFVNAMLLRGSGLGVDQSLNSSSSTSATLISSRPVSLQERDLKREQLERAATALTRFRFVDVAESDWNVLVSLLHLTQTTTTKTAISLSKQQQMLLEQCQSMVTQNDRDRVGEAWTLLGVARYSLLAPKTKLDPQSKSRVTAEVLRRRRTTLQTSIQALRLNRYWATGSLASSSSSKEERAMQQRLRDVETRLRELELRGIAIEREDDFERCVEEIDSFLKTVGDPSRVLELSRRSATSTVKEKELESRREMFFSVCAAFCHRVREQYPSCCDVVDPFIAALYMTMHGLRMQSLNQRKQQQQQLGGMKENSQLLQRLACWPRRGEEMLLSHSLGPKFNTKLVLAAFPALELARMESLHQSLSLDDHVRLRRAFIALTEQWRRDRAEEERKRREKEASVTVKKSNKGGSALAKEEGKTAATSTAAPLDPKDEKDLKRMFPDFHSEFAAKTVYGDEEMNDDNGYSGRQEREDLLYESRANRKGADDDGDEEEDDDEIDTSFQTLNADQVESLVDAFISLYSSKDQRSKRKQGSVAEAADALRLQVFTRGFDASADLVSAVQFIGNPDVDRDAIASASFALKTSIADLNM